MPFQNVNKNYTSAEHLVPSYMLCIYVCQVQVCTSTGVLHYFSRLLEKQAKACKYIC